MPVQWNAEVMQEKAVPRIMHIFYFILIDFFEKMKPNL